MKRNKITQWMSKNKSLLWLFSAPVASTALIGVHHLIPSYLKILFIGMILALISNGFRLLSKELKEIMEEHQKSLDAIIKEHEEDYNNNLDEYVQLKKKMSNSPFRKKTSLNEWIN